MAKNKAPSPQNESPVVFEYSREFQQTLARYTRGNSGSAERLKEFMRIKAENPMAPFGGNDKNFATNSVFGQNLPKARKAHLTHDLSIIYELSGRNPTKIILDGIFSHADLGTGTPPNTKLQKNAVKRISNARLEEDDSY